jgi:hypothetical protein
MMDKTTAVDANDPIVVLGFGSKGYVAPYYKDASDKQNIEYEKSIDDTQTKYKG